MLEKNQKRPKYDCQTVVLEKIQKRPKYEWEDNLTDFGSLSDICARKEPKEA